MYAQDKKTLVGIDHAHVSGSAAVGNLVLRTEFYIADICRVTGICPSRHNASQPWRIQMDEVLDLTT